MKRKIYYRIFKGRWPVYILLLLLGVLLGRVFFHSGGHEDSAGHQHAGEEKVEIWTCSMHPQIRMTEPGKCPICGMDLIPLVSGGTVHHDHDAVHLSREAAELANVHTTRVAAGDPAGEIRLYGMVQLDERLLQSQVSHVSGRIEKLFVNFTGETVTAGQKLAEIYSPELVTAQQELLETAGTRQIQPLLYEASREKLRHLKLTDDQISAIENSGTIISSFTVVSNTSGTVISRRVSTGDYVSRGTVLYDIAGLSRVWLMLDAYESDLPFIRTGQQVSFRVEAVPGRDFSGTVAFVDPLIDPLTRVAGVRVDVGNRSGMLKPGMFATGSLVSDMAAYRNSIVVPKSAVLWTGKRSIVYVKDPQADEPVFRLREVKLGPAIGNAWVITGGLAEGEEIVTRGTFSVDAAAQLEGKPSMMNRTESGGPGESAEASEPAGIRDMRSMPLPGDSRSEVKNRVVSRVFVRQLTDVLEHYLLVKNALVLDDPDKAGQEASGLRQALDRTDMNLLTGDDHVIWMDLSKRISDGLSVLSGSGDLERQRKGFQLVSDNLYTAIRTFGLADKTVYYQYCPMYDNDRGGYWLSEDEAVRNPYFGNMMLTCGETKEKLSY
ncbi:MAG TPA: efflux RND transporter periplasmic adaptor subunit [Bacteroidales bacterium]|nr:efflux RND transporter periplasmic adaptor subunit [Bacteroidales bacterium]HQH25123.1 efflux RND transporter periplasmic adaptor subunit [Bacteroidales bacterium]HQJ83443.1 efflux RND transporter periplasmic adaptor subunit [Bacteroidales bacterium]